MDTSIFSQIVNYIMTNWVKIVAALWLVEQVLRVISEMTPWKWDDNIAKVFTGILKKFFPKRQPTPPPTA
jgi:hypothetical protein